MQKLSDKKIEIVRRSGQNVSVPLGSQKGFTLFGFLTVTREVRLGSEVETESWGDEFASCCVGLCHDLYWTFEVVFHFSGYSQSLGPGLGRRGSLDEPDDCPSNVPHGLAGKRRRDQVRRALHTGPQGVRQRRDTGKGSPVQSV